MRYQLFWESQDNDNSFIWEAPVSQRQILCSAWGAGWACSPLHPPSSRQSFLHWDVEPLLPSFLHSMSASHAFSPFKHCFTHTLTFSCTTSLMQSCLLLPSAASPAGRAQSRFGCSCIPSAKWVLLTIRSPSCGWADPPVSHSSQEKQRLNKPQNKNGLGLPCTPVEVWPLGLVAWRRAMLAVRDGYLLVLEGSVWIFIVLLKLEKTSKTIKSNW